MKVGGGLQYVAGPMGAGKSYYAVARQLVPTMLRGGYAITNVELIDGWEKIVAAHVGRTASASKRRRLESRLLGLYVFERELHEAMRYRLPGHGEARGCFVWDEGHNDLNNRSWKDDGRAELLEWATQLRKLGFTGFLLSQSVDNTDAQLRRVCNFVVRLQNQREQTRMLGVRVSPWPLFLACWYPAHVPLNAGRAVATARVERYFLGWQRRLYDTFGLYHGLAEGAEGSDDSIALPAGGWPAGSRSKVPRRVAPATPANRPGPPGRRRSERAA